MGEQWVSGRVRESSDGLRERPGKDDRAKQQEAAMREAAEQANPELKEKADA